MTNAGPSASTKPRPTITLRALRLDRPASQVAGGWNVSDMCRELSAVVGLWWCEIKIIFYGPGRERVIRR